MDCYVGEIRPFAGLHAPLDWAFCLGQILPISGNEVLYSLIGTQFGGDGRVNFGLPNLQGRLPMGTGTGTGLSPRAMGASGGSDVVALTLGQIPAHSHTLNASPETATSVSPGPNVTFGTVSNGMAFYNDTNKPPTGTTYVNAACIPQSGGNGLPHDNVMPTTVLNYIICLNGMYPPVQ
ncbi:MAG: tail fiber protein [Asticcacaulis sp.]|uniref:phage tail protein n=1 Tax=Asticcacaulis sp. TaxID=1872648 RepID=UPI0025B94F88|nr:tail fiber protein [Asticcacaulis sp.]MCA1935018.1 tail fiber protein [Asticcacaulis sp.]